VGKVAFSIDRKVSAHTPYCRKFVSIRHGGLRVHNGALAEEYTMLSTTLMVVEDC